MTATAVPRSLLPLLVGVVGIAMFSIMDALMKGLTLSYGAVVAVFWRSLVSLGLTTVLVIALREPMPGKASLKWNLLRGVLMTIAGVTFFYGLARLPLADALAISFVAPLMLIVLAAAFLGEKVRAAAALAGGVGFVGVLIILLGRLEAVQEREDLLLGGGAVLTSAVAYAAGMVVLRYQAQTDRALTMVWLQPMVQVGLLVGPALYFRPALPAAEDWSWIIGSALLTSASQLAMIWAYARAEAQVLAPLEYTAFLWAALFGWWLYAEPLSLSTVFGAALIVGGCLIAARRGAG
jgi:S-adenosylmethionine uptake transporter